jgi:hypothetical protein
MSYRLKVSPELPEQRKPQTDEDRIVARGGYPHHRGVPFAHGKGVSRLVAARSATHCDLSGPQYTGNADLRIPSAWRLALDQQRLLIVSPFEKRHRRATAVLAEQRNRVVAALAAEVFVAHAGRRTKTEQLCAELLNGGTRVHVLDLPDNAHLIENGALPIQLGHIRTMAKRFEGGVT